MLNLQKMLKLAQQNGGVDNIKGKSYFTVAFRLMLFRSMYPISTGWRISTDLMFPEAKNSCFTFKATIYNPEGKEVANGWCSEAVDQKHMVNKNSALENAETGAIGRALANAGFCGTNIASADEVLAKLSAPSPSQKSIWKNPGWEKDGVDQDLIPSPWRNKKIATATWIDFGSCDDKSLAIKKSDGSGVWTPKTWVEWQASEAKTKELRDMWMMLYTLVQKKTPQEPRVLQEERKSEEVSTPPTNLKFIPGESDGKTILSVIGKTEGWKELQVPDSLLPKELTSSILERFKRKPIKFSDLFRDNGQGYTFKSEKGSVPCSALISMWKESESKEVKQMAGVLLSEKGEKK